MTPGIDFNKLLKAAMTCELQGASHASTKAKAMQFGTGLSDS